LIAIGVALALLRVVSRVGGLAWFGRVPAEIQIERGATRVYAPLPSLLLVSLVLSQLPQRWL
jgi:hypothetical protein